MSESEEKKEAIDDSIPRPDQSEECSVESRSDRADAFMGRVADILFGGDPAVPVSDSMILDNLETTIRLAKTAMKENTDLKAKNGAMSIQIDTLNAELTQSRQKERVGADIAIKASQALSKLQGAYGDDLSWDNIVERAGGAMGRLQSQAPLMAAAEMELQKMRQRLSVLEPDKMGEDDSKQGRRGGMPPLPEFRRPPLPGIPSLSMPLKGEIEDRMGRLEEDLAIFRFIGRLGGRLFGLDSKPDKG